MSHTGVCCGITTVPPRRGGRRLLRLLGECPSPNVICFSDGTRTSTMTFVVQGGADLHMRTCRTSQAGRSEVAVRRRFLRSRLSLVYTADTFKVKVGGTGVHCIVRCRVPGSLRRCIRRVNETKHSKRRDATILLCSRASCGFGIGVLRNSFPDSFAVRDTVGGGTIGPSCNDPARRALLRRVLHRRLAGRRTGRFVTTQQRLGRGLLGHVGKFTRASGYEHTCVSTCFKGDDLIGPDRYYSGYNVRRPPLINAVVFKGTFPAGTIPR